MKNTESIIGKKFGKLIVLLDPKTLLKNGKKQYAQTLCKCDCGTLRTVYLPDLKRST